MREKHSLLDNALIDHLEQLNRSDAARSLVLSYHSYGKRSSSDEGTRLNLSGNDYLGLSERKDLAEEFAQLYPQYTVPCGSTSSRLLMGNYTIASLFEEEIAQALQHESALLFNSGYHANTAILPALTSLGKCHILADKLIHASIIDGIRLSGASFDRFRHNDWSHLEQLIMRHHDKDWLIVVVESLYSMDGDCAHLPTLVALKAKYPHLILYVDEAHAIGTLGEKGYGLAEEQGVLPSIDILVGTFGKAVNSMGAYAAVSSPLRSFLINKARSLIFSTMLPEASVAWSRFLFNKLPELTQERRQLYKITNYFRQALLNKGIASLGERYIVPIVVGNNETACLWAKKLQSEGFEVRPIRYPTVPQGSARLRLSLTAAMNESDIAPLLAILAHL